MPLQQPQPLIAARRPHGNDHAPAVGQLVDQRLGNVLGRGGDDDGVEGRGLRPSLIAVAGPDMDILVMFPENLFGAFGQRFNNFDGINTVAEFGQNCGLIA